MDIGKVYKAKIRHDDSGFSSSWLLDRIEVQDQSPGGETYIFHCERWLSKKKEDKRIERSLYVPGYEGDMSSTSTLKSGRSGSMISLDSINSRDPFSKSPRLGRKQSSLEDVPEGPSKLKVLN